MDASNIVAASQPWLYDEQGLQQLLQDTNSTLASMADWRWEPCLLSAQGCMIVMTCSACQASLVGHLHAVHAIDRHVIGCKDILYGPPLP